MKILFVANLLKKHIDLFHLPYIEQLIIDGNKLDILAKNDHKNPSELLKYKKINVNKLYDIDFTRNLFSIKHFKNFIKIKKILKENNYDLIITNTPIPSALLRLAIRKNTPTKIIYFAHGFHFFKGSTIYSKLFYLPMEYFLSKKTSLLITINDEDYEFSRKYFNCKVIKINGVGFKDTFYNVEDLRAEEEVIKKSNKKINLISVGELSDRKNHIEVLNALKSVDPSKYHYSICGEGKNKNLLLKYIKKFNINCSLLGHTQEIKKNVFQSDIFILPSKHEGLPVALMEAMAMKKLCIVSNVRGNRDLINHENGFIYNNLKELSEIIKFSINNLNKTDNLREKAFQDSQKYSFSKVFNQIMECYRIR
jgi:glycosyltransferase involved in cell wall biosynthesis